VVFFEAVTARSSLVLMLLFSGCATTVTLAPKLPFDEAMGWSSTQARVREAPIEDPHASSSLAVSMRRLSEVSRAERSAVTRGAPMTAAHVEAWGTTLTEVERVVALPPRRSSVLDSVRTRLQLETELEADGWAYGDVPLLVTDRVQRALRELSSKLALQTAGTRRTMASMKLHWPVTPVLVTSAYGDRLHPIHGEHRFHAGADLAAQTSQSVSSAEAGIIIFSGWNGGYGKQVEVQHDGHLTTRYSHLDALMVQSGQRVKRGELLGLAGQTGLATGVHLHFEVRRDGEALDPEFVLDSPGAMASFGASP